ncbi:hypothetical protein [Actinophytocola sp.]|uniref:hypothetical protein n=1 Tax=Actinophytocola sp. TaxID=1872138 RepID=UPI003D6A9685
MHRGVDVHRPVSDAAIDLAVLVAQADAEERYVYPKLRECSTIGTNEAEYGARGRAEGYEVSRRVLAAARCRRDGELD